MQEGYRKCSCYPGHLRPSNNSCQGKSLKCFKHVLYHLGHIKYKICIKTMFNLGQFRSIIDNDKEKTCMSGCVDQTFDVTVSSNTFPSEGSFDHRKFFCKTVRKVLSCFILSLPTIYFRKLTRLTCSDKYVLKAFEKRYPNLCNEVKYFININSCNQNAKWVARDVSTNYTRTKLFEGSILR